MARSSGNIAVNESAKFRTIFESVGDGIFVCDATTGAFTEINPAGCTMFGYSREELRGRNIEALSTGVPPYTQRDAFAWLAAARNAGPQLFEWRCRTRDGELFWAEISLRRAALDGRDVGLAVIRDITERKRKEAEVAQEALHDSLTGLPNRRDFDLTLMQEISRCQRYGGALCVAMGDIDHFKRVNDTFGHPAGDAVLKALAAFMGDSLRRIDYIARWGGEEFILLLPQTGIDVAVELLNRLRTRISVHVIPEIEQAVTLSFGVTAYRPSDTPDDLLTRIDRALYQSKESGRNKVSRI